MNKINFSENDSASQLYYCSEGGGHDGDYYKSTSVDPIINAAKGLIAVAPDIENDSVGEDWPELLAAWIKLRNALSA